MIKTAFDTILLALLISKTESNECPPSCKCLDVKQTVECAGKDLSIIPEGIGSATQILDVSGNNFRVLQKENFLKLKLINLLKLYLRRCRISFVQDDAFKGLSDLVELDLSENILKTVPTGAFLNCPSLIKLSLRKNPLKRLKRLAFNHLSFLNTLDLSGCEIITVHEAAFNGLYNLEWLNLSKNKLRSLPDIKHFSSMLKSVQLKDNPWTCNCSLQNLNSWISKDKIPILREPICKKPIKYKNISAEYINNHELACNPQANNTSFYFEVKEGNNISLWCQIYSDEPVQISWLIEGQIITNNSEPTSFSRFIYFIEEKEDFKQSILNIYNITLTNNGIYYCAAKNQAGVAFLNYTIAVVSKERASREKSEKGFSFALFSAIIALALLFITLFCINRARDVYKCKLRRKKYSRPKCSVNLGKIANTYPGFKACSNSTRIINKNIPNNAIKSNSMPMWPVNRKINPYMTATKTVSFSNMISHGLKRHQTISDFSTKSYLKPTLTVQSRPVSAPSFERYIEGYFANRYPTRAVKDSSVCFSKPHKSVLTS